MNTEKHRLETQITLMTMRDIPIPVDLHCRAVAVGIDVNALIGECDDE